MQSPAINKTIFDVIFTKYIYEANVSTKHFPGVGAKGLGIRYNLGETFKRWPALPDFIPWEPGTSYPFCRTEVKKDGGKFERRLAQNGFCSSKKSHK